MAGKYRNLWYKVCKYGLSVLPDTLFHNAVGFIMHRRFHVSYHWMNTKNPSTFSEKLNWLKTHPVVPNESELADKYDVRDFIKRKIGFLTEKANFLVFFLRKITILWGWVFLAMARCQ